MKKLIIAIVVVIVMVLGLSSPGYAGQSPSVWSQVGNLTGDAATVHSLVEFNGTLYAGTGIAGSGVWSWNGAVWSQVGNLTGDAATVQSLVVFNGTLYAGTGGGVWYWNGTGWSQLGNLTGKKVKVASVQSLVVFNGTLYAGTGDNGVWSWNGTAWSQVGKQSDNMASVTSFAAINGTLYAGTATGGGSVWYWNGTAWSEVGNLTYDMISVISLVESNGTLYACGISAGGQSVWSWNGSAWSPVGSLPVDLIAGNLTASLCAVNGTLYAGTDYGVWSWNGSAWSPVVVRFTTAGDDIAQCLVAVDGKLYAGTGGSGVWSRSLTPVTPAEQTVFTDVPGSYWAYDDIEKLSGSGCIYGYPDGTFKPEATITRAEFVSVLDKAINIQVSNWAGIKRFDDVPPGDWFFGSVEESVYAGIAKGYGNNFAPNNLALQQRSYPLAESYGNNFAPNNPITRQELAIMMVNAIDQQGTANTSVNTKTGFADDKNISPWARGFVVTAVRDELLKGYPDNTFQPQGNTTRAEACAMIVNMLNAKK